MGLLTHAFLVQSTNVLGIQIRALRCDGSFIFKPTLEVCLRKITVLLEEPVAARWHPLSEIHQSLFQQITPQHDAATTMLHNLDSVLWIKKPHPFSCMQSVDHDGQTMTFWFHLTREHSSKTLLTSIWLLNAVFHCATAFQANGNAGLA